MILLELPAAVNAGGGTNIRAKIASSTIRGQGRDRGSGAQSRRRRRTRDKIITEARGHGAASFNVGAGLRPAGGPRETRITQAEEACIACVIRLSRGPRARSAPDTEASRLYVLRALRGSVLILPRDLHLLRDLGISNGEVGWKCCRYRSGRDQWDLITVRLPV